MLTSNSTDVQSVLHVIDRCLVSVDGWDTAIQSRVPVRATVVGKIYEPNFNNGRTARAINHTYEFAEFRGQFPDYVDPTHLFETPSGYVCPGRKNTKPLPTPSNYFRFTSEILDPNQKTIGFIKVSLTRLPC
uniref:LolA-like domain-containing protein n=1 Tax=Magallana gigas TaxID=29159 RepID=K1Q8K1_MAGGI